MEELRAAVYQRFLTDNIVGLDLQENDSTRLHDDKLTIPFDEGSTVVTHNKELVPKMRTLGVSRDEKILALANVFSLLYQKEKLDLPDMPMWWRWKQGRIQMQIAFQRLKRWCKGSRPMDVIALMRYAMVSYYTLADGDSSSIEEIFSWKKSRPVIPKTSITNLVKETLQRFKDTYKKEPTETYKYLKVREIKEGTDVTVWYEKKKFDDEEKIKDNIAIIEEVEVSVEKKIRSEAETTIFDDLYIDKQGKPMLVLDFLSNRKLGAVDRKILSKIIATFFKETIDILEKKIEFQQKMTDGETVTEQTQAEITQINQRIKRQNKKIIIINKTLNLEFLETLDKIIEGEKESVDTLLDEKTQIEDKVKGLKDTLKLQIWSALLNDSVGNDTIEEVEVKKRLKQSWYVKVMSDSQRKTKILRKKADLLEKILIGTNVDDKIIERLNEEIEKVNTKNLFQKIDTVDNNGSDSYFKSAKRNAVQTINILAKRNEKRYATAKEFDDIESLTIRRIVSSDNENYKIGLLPWSCKRNDYRTTEDLVDAFKEYLAQGRRLSVSGREQEHYGDVAYRDFFTELSNYVMQEDEAQEKATRENVQIMQGEKKRRRAQPTVEEQLRGLRETIETLTPVAGDFQKFMQTIIDRMDNLASRPTTENITNMIDLTEEAKTKVDAAIEAKAAPAAEGTNTETGTKSETGEENYELPYLRVKVTELQNKLIQERKNSEDIQIETEEKQKQLEEQINEFRQNEEKLKQQNEDKLEQAQALWDDKKKNLESEKRELQVRLQQTKRRLSQNEQKMNKKIDLQSIISRQQLQELKGLKEQNTKLLKEKDKSEKRLQVLDKNQEKVDADKKKIEELEKGIENIQNSKEQKRKKITEELQESNAWTAVEQKTKMDALIQQLSQLHITQNSQKNLTDARRKGYNFER